MEYPFTNAQWKELERQALIYKHMVASLPIPIHLLLPTSTTSSPAATSSSSSPTSLMMMRYAAAAKGKVDAEAGRCKRTDGKKWRCSRDVAPNHKYCERHMNRGRPRSRKHVEQQHQSLNTKKPRHHPILTTATATATAPLTPTQTHHFLVGGPSSSPCSTSLPYYHHQIHPYTSSSPQNLEWMMRTEQPQWAHLMQSRMEIAEDHPQEESFLNLNRDCTTSLFLNPNDADDDNENDVLPAKTSRTFIDAWSNTTPTSAALDIDEAADVGNLSPSSLTLSMGNWLNPTSASCSWVSPLAEVLRTTAAPGYGGGGGSDGTPVASPSGVLQKTTMTSLSDSSNCSSPKPKPEITLF